jgi:CubicO group peptidase (beta-lactamase class C family)
VHGFIEPGLEAVEVEFERNFKERGEVGASCCIYHRGEKVVDLWGGYRDRRSGAPWEEDTIVPVFSTTKGPAALTLALANSRGFLEYDQTVSFYWPEFAQAGKQDITVRQLLAHQAGLCALDEPLTLEMLNDLDAFARAIAKQRPAWEPGARCGYHALSLGWYEQEIIRRVDPAHRTLGRFFAEEIAGPLGLEFYIGLPREVPDRRLARLVLMGPWRTVRNFKLETLPQLLTIANPRSLARRSASNPGFRLGYMNRREYLSLEMPAANGVGNARALARLYGAVATGGRELSLGPETLEALYAPAEPPREGTRDLVLMGDFLFSLGFMKRNSVVPFGSGASALGMPGMGGSIGFADPDAGVGFGYAQNMLGLGAHDDPRPKALREAFYKSL